MLSNRKKSLRTAGMLVSCLLLLGTSVTAFRPVFAQNLTGLSDDQLISKFQEQLTIIDKISAIVDETAVFDIADQSTLNLRSKVSTYVEDGEVRPKLLKIIDDARQELNDAKSSINNLDEDRTNRMLDKATKSIEKFISTAEKEKGKKISELIADELVTDGAQIMSDLGKRERELVPILPLYDLTTVEEQFDRMVAEVQILDAVVAELKSRGYEFQVEVEEIPVEQPSDPSSAAQIRAASDPSVILKLKVAISFAGKVPIVNAITSGVQAGLTVLEVDNILAERGTTPLQPEEKFSLLLLSSAFYLAGGSLIEKGVEKTVLVRLFDAVGKRIASDPVLGSSFIGRIVSDLLHTAAEKGTEFLFGFELAEWEANLIEFVRRINNIISGFVLEDLLGDGLGFPPDFSLDRPKEGWTVELIPAASPEVQTDVTDPDGSFSFSNLDDGIYNVRLQLQSDWVNTTPITISGIELIAGQNSVHNNFGVFKTVTVSGMVIEDLGGDGVISGEPAIDGWKVNLLNERTDEMLSAFTDETGSYSFSGVTHGPHVLLQDSSANPSFTQTYPINDAGEPIDYSFTPISNTDRDSFDFGNTLQEQPSVPGLVAHWKFDEGSGNTAIDSSGNGNTGSLLNGASYAPASSCMVGNSCLYLDGLNDYVSVPRHASLEPPSAITISMWVKPLSGGALIDKGFTSHVNPFYSYNLQLEQELSKLESIWGLNTGGRISFIGEGSTEVLASNNSWQLITLAYDGSSMKEYVNAVVKASAAKTGTISYYDTPLTIGKYTNLNRFTNAVIDDVRIYNRALTSAEIQQLYQENAPQPATPGLIGYWKFDEGSGSAAADSSGSENTGNLANSPAWSSSCISGSCLSFDGSGDHVVVPDSGILDGMSELTVSAWVKRQGFGTLQIVAAKGWLNGDDTSSYGLWFDPANNNRVSWGVDTNISFNTAISTQTITDTTTFHHLVGTYKNGEFAIYIDGSIGQSGTLSGTILNTSDPLTFGKRSHPTAPNYFAGTIDEIRMYNRALSAEEVQQLYQEHAPLPDAVWQYREYKYYADASPDYVFVKESAGSQRLDIHSQGSESVGYGFLFKTFNKSDIQGRDIKITWEHTKSGPGVSANSIGVLDGSYDRSSSSDFPGGANIAIKGGGQIGVFNGSPLEGWSEKTDTLGAGSINYAASTHDQVTILVRSEDGHFGTNYAQKIRSIEIVGYAKWTFENPAINPEQSGTVGDYGTIGASQVTRP